MFTTINLPSFAVKCKRLWALLARYWCVELLVILVSSPSPYDGFMNNHQPNKAFGPVISRLADAMIHVPIYSCDGSPRLAVDAGVDRSTVTRLKRSALTNPSLALAARLTAALEAKIGCHIDPRDLFAEHGRFLTPHICDLFPTCPGCLPDVALNESGERQPLFHGINKGEWVTSKSPRGYFPAKGGL